MEINNTNIKKLAAPSSGMQSISRFRSSSTSIQAAIDDPRLSASLSDLSQQTEFHQNETRNPAEAKAFFEKRVQRFEENILYHDLHSFFRYFYQLTSGCGNEDCSYSLCASNQTAPHFSTELAAAMAVQLASNLSKLLFCPRIPQELAAINNNKLNTFGQSPLTTPFSSPTHSAEHSRQNSALPSSSNLSRTESTQRFVELDSVPTPFLNSLFSFPSFNSIFAEDGGSARHGKGNLLSDSLNPLHRSRSRFFEDAQQNEHSGPDIEPPSLNPSMSDIYSSATGLFSFID